MQQTERYFLPYLRKSRQNRFRIRLERVGLSQLDQFHGVDLSMHVLFESQLRYLVARRNTPHLKKRPTRSRFALQEHSRNLGFQDRLHQQRTPAPIFYPLQADSNFNLEVVSTASNSIQLQMAFSSCDSHYMDDYFTDLKLRTFWAKFVAFVDELGTADEQCLLAYQLRLNEFMASHWGRRAPWELRNA
jgi:hypothetical protein